MKTSNKLVNYLLSLTKEKGSPQELVDIIQSSLATAKENRIKDDTPYPRIRYKLSHDTYTPDIVTSSFYVQYLLNGSVATFNVSIKHRRNGDVLSRYTPSSVSLAGQFQLTLYTAAQLIALYYIKHSEEQDFSKEDWINFIKIHNEEEWRKNQVLTTAWISLVVRFNLSEEEQKTLFTSFGWGESITCPLSNLVFSPKLMVPTTYEGNETLCCSPEWVSWHNPNFSSSLRWFDSLPISETETYPVGYVNKEQEYVNIVIHNTKISYPKRIVMEKGYTHECEGCHSLVNLAVTPLQENLCPICVKEKYRELEPMDYGTDPLQHLQIKLPTTKKTSQFPKMTHPVLLGCELEYNCDVNHSLQSRIQLIQHLKGHVIFKRDGSLNQGGFEIVSAPATKEIHFSVFQPVFANFPSKLEVTSTTGMHVHLSRTVITPLMLAKMIDFMNRPENKQFIELVGERQLNNYCSLDESRSFGFILENEYGSRGSRSVTLNINKRPTVEFRIFKAPEHFSSFAKNLEFVTTLLNFYKTAVLNYTPKESRYHDSFLKYVKEKNKSRDNARNESPYLYEFLKTKGAL